MSCQAEKLLQMMEYEESPQLKTILDSRTRVFETVSRPPSDNQYQTFKPSYDNGGSGGMPNMGASYGTAPSPQPTVYNIGPGRAYDLAPVTSTGMMMGYLQAQVANDNYQKMPDVEANDAQMDMLAEMIARARGEGVEQEWMSTMQ